MTTYALVLFGIAALGGLVLAFKVLTGRLAPWPISIIHALVGAAGLVTLLLAVVKVTNSSQVTAALGLLVVAALGGFFLASFHLRKQVAPKAVVLIHAGVAIAGFLTLLTAALNF
jgi:hypothetical protein